MEEYISLSQLNDYIFCPYSIYLHNVYMGTDESLYHATPQTMGKVSHSVIEAKKASNLASDLISMSVASEEYHLYGKIDIYKGREKRLIERKYMLKQIYQGQIYQLWGQYLCMTEMGYNVESLAFYEISTNKMISVEIPDDSDLSAFKEFLRKFKSFNPEEPISVNMNKCAHCIYCSLCDKTTSENVYQ